MTARDETAGTAGTGDLYETLGVTSDASEEQIATAYRRLAREHHPDTNPEAEPGRFSGIADAYDVLRDGTRRQAYDRTRRARAQAAHQATGTSVPIHHRVPTEPIEAPRPQEFELHLSFEQAALGTTAPVTVHVEAPCASCGGTGTASEPCASCAGAGATARASGSITIRHVCSDCGGTGNRLARCHTCHGARVHGAERELTIRVPPGVDDGARLRVPVPHSQATLTAVVRCAPHDYFGRRGHDLTIELPVTIAEAALGAVITVPTLTDAVAIRLPPGTRHGRVLRVRGRGIPFDDGPGDLLVTVNVVIPETLSPEQRAALEAFAAATESPRARFERHQDRADDR